jgi:RNA-directed DNA polymerase
MPSPLLVKAEARKQISTRAQLAVLLGVHPDFVRRVAGKPADFYGHLTVPKANGELRIINPPRKPLRSAQRALLRVLYQRLRIPAYLHGGIPRRSIFTHASLHVGHTMVATLDVKSFFPSTTRGHIEPVFAIAGIVEEALEDAIALTMLNNSLPQGSPTSSLMANLAFIPADRRFLLLCARKSLNYSRYVDDIAVSGDYDFSELRGPFVNSIRESGYEVAPKKVNFWLSGKRQVVTGLVVNDKLRPTSEFVKELKHCIRLCMKLGPELVAASEGQTVRELKACLTGRVGHVAQCDPRMGKHLRGMIRGVNWRSLGSRSPSGLARSHTARA